jgi:hypothetical protein
MKKIPIQDVDEGMVLAAPISDSRGREVFASGTLLDNAAVSRIFQLGINEIEIQTDADNRSARPESYTKYGVTSDTELVAAIEAKFASLFFRLDPNDEVTQEIKAVAVQRELDNAGIKG